MVCLFLSIETNHNQTTQNTFFTNQRIRSHSGTSEGQFDRASGSGGEVAEWV